MILTDINVLVYAHREDAPNHSAYRNWLEEQINWEIFNRLVREAEDKGQLDPGC